MTADDPELRDAIQTAAEALAQALDLLRAPKPPRVQIAVRLDQEMWTALNDLATRKTAEDGHWVTVHDLLIEGLHHVLAKARQ